MKLLFQMIVVGAVVLALASVAQVVIAGFALQDVLKPFAAFASSSDPPPMPVIDHNRNHNRK